MTGLALVLAGWSLGLVTAGVLGGVLTWLDRHEESENDYEYVCRRGDVL